MTGLASDTPAVGNVMPRNADRMPKSAFSDDLSRRFAAAPRARQEAVYEFTRDPALLHQYFLMREQMFINVWGLKHFSGQKDEFDDISDIMVARKGLQCIGGGRITISSPQEHHLMPMEKDDLCLRELFPMLDLQETSYAEFSRLAILPEFRGMDGRGEAVFPEIARRFIEHAIAHDVEYAFNIAPVPLARHYRQAVQSFGFKWDICHDIAVPQRDEYEGIRMIISVMDLSLQVRGAKAARAAAQASPAAMADEAAD